MPYGIIQKRLPAEIFDKILDICVGDVFRAVRDKHSARAFYGLMAKLAVLDSESLTNLFPPIGCLLDSYQTAFSKRLNSVRMRDFEELVENKRGSLREKISKLDDASATLGDGSRKLNRIACWLCCKKNGVYTELDYSVSIKEWNRRLREKQELEDSNSEKKKRPLPGTEEDAVEDDSDSDGDPQPPAKRVCIDLTF